MRYKQGWRKVMGINARTLVSMMIGRAVEPLTPITPWQTPILFKHLWQSIDDDFTAQGERA